MESKEVADLLLELTKLMKDNPNTPILAAEYTVYGMLGVAAITLLGQFITTYILMRSEMRKVVTQTKASYMSEMNAAWNQEVKNLVADLVMAVESESPTGQDKVKILKCTHSLNLMLNEDIPSHKRLNSAVNELALNVNGWERSNTLFNLQAQLTEAAKEVIYQPQI